MKNYDTEVNADIDVDSNDDWYLNLLTEGTDNGQRIGRKVMMWRIQIIGMLMPTWMYLLDPSAPLPELNVPPQQWRMALIYDKQPRIGLADWIDYYEFDYAITWVRVEVANRIEILYDKTWTVDAKVNNITTYKSVSEEDQPLYNQVFCHVCVTEDPPSETNTAATYSNSYSWAYSNTHQSGKYTMPVNIDLTFDEPLEVIFGANGFNPTFGMLKLLLRGTFDDTTDPAFSQWGGKAILATRLWYTDS